MATRAQDPSALVEGPTPPLYTSGEEGAVTDASVPMRRPRRRGRGHGGRARPEVDSSETDASGVSTDRGPAHFKKKVFLTGVVSFTDPPVLTWHRPIYFSYLAVVSGTLP